MLDSLDAIDWASLRHAYGSAIDVPDLLRALASSDQAARRKAIYELFGNVWHQGTVYPASAAAIPFLYELLRSGEIADKEEIACLVACIAAGQGYLQVHSVGIAGQACREMLAADGKSLEQELAREADEVQSVRRAASLHLLDLLPYVSAPDPETRRAVAEAFGVYPEHRAAILPALRKAAETELDPDVQEALVKTIERLASDWQ